MGNGAFFLTERRYETGRYEESWEKLEGMEEKGQENEGEAVKNTRKHTHTRTHTWVGLARASREAVC